MGEKTYLIDSSLLSFIIPPSIHVSLYPIPRRVKCAHLPRHTERASSPDSPDGFRSSLVLNLSKMQLLILFCTEDDTARSIISRDTASAVQTVSAYRLFKDTFSSSENIACVFVFDQERIYF